MENLNDNNRKNEELPGQEPDLSQNVESEQESAYVESTTNVIHEEAPGRQPVPVEDNYSQHEHNPGPSPEAVNEDNDKGAGPVMKWLIPIIVVILLIYWFLIRK
ncbi:hypothetical protein [Pedobacter antarcticus]|uniref:Uncharacterized protein n=2 Tax=Pedobacter antarcticus TaxID=34086 RepID=A0A081PD22_9SPHI|nr:hypothetical protein [Pedobacter antarcticus]KEQ28595.1 hypothetical protein N180_12395 [Pedobacter antarcticus 4BY]SDL48633.1 hypothetical protein SAMN04488084_101450 [Pedobacter antarcticus]SFE36609.1 hypothetical protein SAMN03003324_00227 [Pedobacter antarcticus]